MPNKLFLSLVTAVLYLFCFKTVYANIVINEFVSDPSSGSEWIELLNTSSSEINLTSFKWTELVGPGTDTERESSPKNLSGVILANGLFVFELNSALNNSGDSIGLYDGDILEDRVTYGKINGFSKDLDAPFKGKSGALISGSWESDQEPTKNKENPSSSVGDYEDDVQTEEEISESKEDTVKKLQKPKAQIKGSEIAYIGIPLKLEGEAFGDDGQQEYSGRYFWNFGDGDFREVKVKNTDSINHIYFYPGEYEILFEYYPNYFTDVPDSFDKLEVKVIDPKVYISKVGDVNDFFIELTNGTNFSVNISGWKIVGLSKIFTFPKNSNLPPKKSLILSPRITGLSALDKNDLKLIDPEGKIIFMYSNFIKPTNSTKIYTENRNYINKNNQDDFLNREDLSALAFKNEKKDEEVVVPFWFSIFSLCILAGLGAISAYYIRKKKTKKENDGEDFEILDE